MRCAGSSSAISDVSTQRLTFEYSTKAFSNPAILKIMEEEGMSIDVVTGGELAFALAVDFPAEKINFHGNNKARNELREAVGAGIGRITIDSFHEIELLNEVAGELGSTQAVNLRLSAEHRPTYSSFDQHWSIGLEIRVLDRDGRR